MLLVETFLHQSAYKGLGLFSKNKIPKGTVWWIRTIDIDKIITAEMLTVIGDSNWLDFIYTYGSLEPNGDWYVCVDNARFVNHSNNPNSGNQYDISGFVISSFAIRDICIGEEITCDYRDCCLESRKNLGFENS